MAKESIAAISITIRPLLVIGDTPPSFITSFSKETSLVLVWVQYIKKQHKSVIKVIFIGYKKQICYKK
jgi:hypothetical protein